MNTIRDLQAEFDRLGQESPSDVDVRQALTERVAAQGKRRRTTALIAVAASVVLVVGGASVTNALLSHRLVGPAAPSPIVLVPEVPLPADTQLIRHQLQPTVSPVTAAAPAGLTGQVWFSAPGQLAVSWFDPGSASNGMAGWTTYTPLGSAAASTGALASVGYSITNDRDGTIRSFGPDGLTTPTVSREDITVGGHKATLDTAPGDPNGAFGFPASQRISWQLSDGRWIHVWASDSANKPSPVATLTQFAAGITEQPQTLVRSVGIGLTLPGLTADSSGNSSPLVGMLGAMLYLCPPGVEPLAPNYSSSSGSGSSEADDNLSNAPTESQTESTSDHTSPCITVAVVPRASIDSGTLPAGTEMTAGGTVAHVDTDIGTAWDDLDGGVIAAVSTPRSGPLAGQISGADLAALVASVRLSPSVAVLLVSSPQMTQSPVTGTSMPQPSSTNEGTSASPDQSSGEAPSAEAPASSGDGTAGVVDHRDPQSVLMAYLDALAADDCATAQSFAAPTFRSGNGELCGAATVTGYSLRGAAAVSNTKPATETFAVNLTTGGSSDGTVPAGDVIWFYTLTQQPSGTWLFTGGGTGP
ncbi:MAG: hypothetical protein ABI382_03355 [Nakamurella sp.]